jgi:hypothetical protein
MKRSPAFGRRFRKMAVTCEKERHEMIIRESAMSRGQFLGRNPDKSLKSFPHPSTSLP